MALTTREQLLEAGLSMLLEHGYNDLGIQALLQQTGVPKGSFYHHFSSKEDFALQVIDRYMLEVHQGLELALQDPALQPLERARRFFELSQEKYRRDGYLGCMLGALGQELSGINPTFARKIESCFSVVTRHIAECLEQARQQGQLAHDVDPVEMANLLLNCWEGAALRSRLLRDPAPLDRMLDFYFAAATRSA
jgi:TetR/AcrR family transcriptional regulator, transcriptional repressor for nem operon